jgi:hypothetical protein
LIFLKRKQKSEPTDGNDEKGVYLSHSTKKKKEKGVCPFVRQ